MRCLEVLVETFHILLSLLHENDSANNGMVVKKKRAVQHESDDEGTLNLTKTHTLLLKIKSNPLRNTFHFQSSNR